MRGLTSALEAAKKASEGVTRYVEQFQRTNDIKDVYPKGKATNQFFNTHQKRKKKKAKASKIPVTIIDDNLRIKMIKWKEVQNERLINPKTAEDIKAKALIEYSGPQCPYCGSTAKIQTAKEYKGKDATYCYWVCPKCTNVSVTTAGKGYMPAGILADAQTRRMRGEVQEILRDKKKELENDRFALSKWIQTVLTVEKESAWVGKLEKNQLAVLARTAQKEIFEKEYGYIFDK